MRRILLSLALAACSPSQPEAAPPRHRLQKPALWKQTGQSPIVDATGAPRGMVVRTADKVLVQHFDYVGRWPGSAPVCTRHVAELAASADEAAVVAALARLVAEHQRQR